MAKDLERGDEVTWQSHGHTVPGTIKKKITNHTEEAGRTVAASQDDPQYLVESKKTGKKAVHKPKSLKRR
jgi:hypothetical protein